MAGLSLSLKYAAPEVVNALEAGKRTIHVNAAVDIWAIGVIAWELLTGQRAFPISDMASKEGQKAVRAAIAGRTQLPWEGRSGATLEGLQKLRGMRRSVLRCLDRNPAERPSAEALLRTWDHAFDNMRTQGTSETTQY